MRAFRGYSSVIDGNSGISHDIEKDVRAVQHHSSPSRSTYLIMSVQPSAKAAKRMSKTILGPAVSEYAFSSANFINRDLSLLEFFRRVLDEARDDSQPLLERLKFIAIFSSNLDEFFQIRVSGLKERLQNNTRVSGDAVTTGELLSEIRHRVIDMVSDQMRCLKEEILPALKREGIVIAAYDSLDVDERLQMDKYFTECVFPLITPQAVDPTHPFPYISGGSINLGMLARPKLTHRIFKTFRASEAGVN